MWDEEVAERVERRADIFLQKRAMPSGDADIEDEAVGAYEIAQILVEAEGGEKQSGDAAGAGFNARSAYRKNMDVLVDFVVVADLRVIDLGRLLHLAVGEEEVAHREAVVTFRAVAPPPFNGHIGNQILHFLGREVKETVGVAVIPLHAAPLGTLVLHLFEALNLPGEDTEVTGVVADGLLPPRGLVTPVPLRTRDGTPRALADSLEESVLLGSETWSLTRSTCRST